MSMTTDAVRKSQTKKEQLEHEMQQTAYAGKHFKDKYETQLRITRVWQRISVTLAFAFIIALCVSAYCILKNNH